MTPPQNRSSPPYCFTLSTDSGASWTLDCTVERSAAAADLKGPHIQGPPGGRFIYLSWGTIDDAGNFTLFRRAKLWLDAVPLAVI
ncbi:MAG TPA: DUF5990 family protein, partial [Chloroflexota bacterium]